MFSIKLIKLHRQNLYLQSAFSQIIIKAHTETCPTKGKNVTSKAPVCPPVVGDSPRAPVCPPVGGDPPKGPICPGSGDGSGSAQISLKRLPKPGKVRMGFLPEEWFLFFHSKTGVTGPYLFGIMLTNYLVSKEIYVMEHEYYSGLSIFVMVYYATKKFGPILAKVLDKEVDAIADAFEKTRTDQITDLQNFINQRKDAQWRAEGQKLLMDAKKENVGMQLEAVYRERLMHVYKIVKGRMDYHVKLYRAQARVQQKWMLQWILSNVMKSITPELEKQVLNRAIADLATVAASQAK